MTWTLTEVYQGLAIIAAVWGVLSCAALWWLSKNFASRTAVETIERRLGAGDDRFVKLERAVGEAVHAAEDAKDAAERATRAAEKVGDAQVELARLGERINTLNELLRRVERDAGKMVDGHLTMGAKA